MDKLMHSHTHMQQCTHMDVIVYRTVCQREGQWLDSLKEDLGTGAL